MKEVNGYYKGYSNSTNRLDFIRYELLNEFGPSFNNKKYYQEDNIIKNKCKKLENKK